MSSIVSVISTEIKKILSFPIRDQKIKNFFAINLKVKGKDRARAALIPTITM
jgi:hypothetical protein